MSKDVIISHLENKQNCLFCNAQLAVSTRNCFNIFKTILFPLEKKACDLIGAVLDQEITENTVHSDVVCKKCFKLVNEFADLETRVSEIKLELITNYKKTTEFLQNSEGSGGGSKTTGVHVVQKKEAQVLQEKPRMKLDAEKLNQIVLNSKGGTIIAKNIFLKQAGKSGTTLDEPKVIVVGDGDLNDVDVEEYEIGEVIEDFEVGNADHEEVVAVQIRSENDENEYVVNQQGGEGDVKHVEMDGNKFTCLLCPSDSENKPFTCESKDLGFMTSHLKVYHDTRVYICDICGVEFRKRNDLSAHLDEHVAQEEGDFQCEVCNRIFSNLRLYRIHKRLHSSQNKSWSCEICGKKYSSRNLLEEHHNTHTGVRPYVCQNCGKDFASKYTFKAHKKTHEARERNFSCSACEKTFLSAQNLIQHEKTHSESKDYVCDTCGKGFVSLRNLETHTVVHSGFKPFICGICGKAFARKAEIKDHERTHTGERPFQCEFCGAQFSQRSNLQSHKRVTHYDDRRYRCGDCGKGFKRRRLLDYHIKAVHTGERPFKCPTCDATFVYPEHFKKHIRIHTGLKPYKCEVCGKAFNSRDNRNAHRFVHSDKKPYECLVCGMGFMRKPLLYNHMQQAGHINDTIVVNQPRLTTDDDQEIATDRDVDIEMTIVEDNSLTHEGVLEEKPKLYLTELNEHVIIQGNEKTLFMADGMKIKTLNEDEDQEQLVDEDGNFVDMDGNIIEIEQLEDDSNIAMTAHINEHGQLVNDQGEIINEHGQILTDDGQSLVVDETVSFAEGDIIVKGEKSEEDNYDKKTEVHYVQIRLPDDANSEQRTWYNIVETDQEVNSPSENNTEETKLRRCLLRLLRERREHLIRQKEREREERERHRLRELEKEREREEMRQLEDERRVAERATNSPEKEKEEERSEEGSEHLHNEEDSKEGRRKSKSPSSMGGKRKKLDVKEVFNNDDDDEDSNLGSGKKRKLVPLDYGEEKEREKDKDRDQRKKEKKDEKKEEVSKSQEEKRKHIKSLIDKIPTDKNALFAFNIDWSAVDNQLMERRIRPWINKKIIEYIGEPEPTLVDFICSKVLAGSQPQGILDDVQMVLDEEAEVFVVKMWRLLIYEIEAKKLGLVK